MIYSSPYPTPAWVSESLYTYSFGGKGLKPDSPAYIDGISGAVLTRRELREYTLKLGYAVREKGALPGDVAMIFR